MSGYRSSISFSTDAIEGGGLRLSSFCREGSSHQFVAPQSSSAPSSSSSPLPNYAASPASNPAAECQTDFDDALYDKLLQEAEERRVAFLAVAAVQTENVAMDDSQEMAQKENAARRRDYLLRNRPILGRADALQKTVRERVEWPSAMIVEERGKKKKTAQLVATEKSPLMIEMTRRLPLPPSGKATHNSIDLYKEAVHRPSEVAAALHRAHQAEVKKIIAEGQEQQQLKRSSNKPKNEEDALAPVAVPSARSNGAESLDWTGQQQQQQAPPPSCEGRGAGREIQLIERLFYHPTEAAKLPLATMFELVKALSAKVESSSKPARF